MPLPTNEYWQTHRIFLKGKLIGKQLSVPSIDDCDWFAATRGTYASEEDSADLFKWSQRHHRFIGRGRRGRPTKEEQRLRELYDDIPVL